MRSNWIILQYANLLVIFNLISGKGVLKQKRHKRLSLEIYTLNIARDTIPKMPKHVYFHVQSQRWIRTIK
jgi:hypothetical protein